MSGERSPDRRIRVAAVYYHLEIGGIETLLIDSLPVFDRSRFDVCFIGTLRRGRQADHLERLGVPVHVARTSRTLPLAFGARKLARLLRDLQIDIVHGHHEQPAQIATIAARLAGTPVTIANLHNVGLFERRGELARERRQAALRDATIHVSERARRDYLDQLGAEPGEDVVVYNGVRVPAFAEPPDDDRRRALLEEFGVAPGARVVLNVARLHPQKDHRVLLDAFGRVLDRIPGTTLLLVGGGRQEAAIREMIRDRGMRDAVRLLGTRTDVRDLYHLADLHVLSSVREGFSVVVLEAMASGVPQVLTDVGGNAEAIGDSGAGTLVPSGDPAALADAMARLLSDDDAAREAAAAARIRAGRFSMDRQIRAIESLYLDLARRKGVVAR